MKVKICGITNREDAMAAVIFGADALGFVFYPNSPRNVTPEQARAIVEKLPPFIATVGVFVNEPADRVIEIMQKARLQVAQLHGDESPEACSIWTPTIKALRVSTFTDLKPLDTYKCCSALLIDTYSPDSYGGTGQTFNWDIAVEAKRYGRVILSGGLTPDNIEKAIKWVKPYAVDVSSGVEAEKGRKDHKKMRMFIERAQAAAIQP